MSERPRTVEPPPADTRAAPDEPPAEAPKPSKDGPGSIDWWLEDGPDSPIAADIEEPEKHL